MQILTSVFSHYNWQALLLLIPSLVGIHLIAHAIAMRVPTLKAADDLNGATFKQRMEKPAYVANQKWNMKWSGVYMLAIFLVILPFCITLEPGPWWRIPVDLVVILMLYDFFYYVTHRFVFHDNGVLGGPLKWMHAVHHQQHNPCRRDSSYIHPLEVAIGLGLYVGTIVLLTLLMGPFHFATIAITFFAFSAINIQNHALWTEDRAPFRYLNYISKMHHHHHAKFTGGNYATITLLYDWMFGTLDHGQGWKKKSAPNPTA